MITSTIITIMTRSVAMITSIIITITMRSAAAAMITSIIITIMTGNVAVDTIMIMSITMTESAAVAITIIMQMRYLQAGEKRLSGSIHVRDLRKSLRLCLLLTNTESFSAQRECYRQRTEHGSTLTWFPRKPRSARVHRSTQAVCA